MALSAASFSEILYRKISAKSGIGRHLQPSEVEVDGRFFFKSLDRGQRADNGQSINQTER